MLTKKAQRWCKPRRNLYLVRSHPENNVFDIEKIKATSRPYFDKVAFTYFCNCEDCDGMRLKSSFSLRDFNLIPNNYNNHKVFINEKKANKYLKEQMK